MQGEALATLVRMYEARKSQGSSAPDKLDKAYGVVADVARENRLYALLNEQLQAEVAVGRSAYTTDKGFLPLVQAVFWGLSAPSDVREGEKLRAQLFQQVVRLLHTHNASAVASSMVLVLLQEVHRIRAADLVVVVTDLLRAISSSQQQQRAQQSEGFSIFYTVELLPQLLLRITPSVVVSVEGSQPDTMAADFSGAEYRGRVLTKLTSLSWPRRFFLQVLKSFRDYDLTQQEERLFCARIYCEVRRELLDTFEQARTYEVFPTIFYSVLQLVCRTQNHLCTRLLTSLLINKSRQLCSCAQSGGVSFLGPTTAELSDREIRVLQSTVLYQLEMGMKQWDRLGKAFLIEYEHQVPPLSSFDIAVLLLVSSHTKFELQVTQYLLRYIVHTYKAKQREDNSPGAVSRKVFADVIMHSHLNSSMMERMIGLGFRLIEYRGLKGDGPILTEDASGGRLNLPPWVDFGVRILLGCFQHHQQLRGNVIDRVVNMIIIQNADCRVYLHLIARIVKRHIAEIGGDLEARIRECLEYIPRMTPENASQLLASLSPLFKTQHGLKTFVILILRKSMFRKDENSRMIAIKGFSLLLCLSSRIFSRNRTLSQLYSQNVTMLSQGFGSSVAHTTGIDADIASQEQDHAMLAEDLYRQFCGIFRTALQLQREVRLVLYAELIKVFRECPALRSSILDLLFHHYSKYYEANESVQPPLKLDLSVSQKKGVYEEPLPYLLHTMTYCLFEMKREMDEIEEETMMDELPATQTAGSERALENLERKVSILFERLRRCELSDFDFDKNSSFASSSDLGYTNRRLASSVIGILEVSMDWTVSTCARDATRTSLREETWHSLLQYAKMHEWICQRLREAETTQKKSDSNDTPKTRRVGTKDTTKAPRNTVGNSVQIASTKGHSGALFRQNSSFRWACLLSPQTLIDVLECGIMKLIAEKRLILTAEEESVVLLCLEKAMETLAVIQTEDEPSINSSKSHSVAHAHQLFMRRLGAVLLKLMGKYCYGEISLTLPTSGKRGSDVAREIERHRRVVRTTVQLLAQLMNLWSKLPSEELQENMVGVVCLTDTVEGINEGSPDCDVGEASWSLISDSMQRLVTELISQDMPDEGIHVLEIVRLIWSRMPLDTIAPHLRWIRELLVSRSHPSQRLLESIVALLLRPHPASGFQSFIAEQIAQSLRQLCNGDEDESSSNPAVQFGLARLNEKNVLTVATVILSKLDECLIDLESRIKEYDLEQRRRTFNFKEDDMDMLKQLEDDSGVPILEYQDRAASHATFKKLCKWLYDVAGALRPFVAMDLNSSATSIRIVRLGGRLCKSLVLLVKDKVRRKDGSLPKFLGTLFTRTAGELSPALLQFIACIHDESKRNGASKPPSSKQNGLKIAKQSKFIPDVIYQLEQYDLTLIKLSKLCKGHDFSAWCKLRQSRDFRFNKARIQRSLTDAGLDKANQGVIDKEDSGTADENVTDVMTTNHSADDTVTDVNTTNNIASENDDTESADEDAPNGGSTRNRLGKRPRARVAETHEEDDEDDDDDDDDDDEVEDEDGEDTTRE